LCDRVDADESPELLLLERKQHLISRLGGTLRAGITDTDILRALHPTPAVGGSPRDNALRELPRLEPFSRGWYAAPVGTFGQDSAEFAVAIRSGLVHGRDVNVYSGAGIVEGSDPEREWEEIENKISDFVKVTRGRVR
jgi:menaquinone-specific isochorismate synthase